MSEYRAVLDELYDAERALLRAHFAIGQAIELVESKSVREMSPEAVERILSAIREGDGDDCSVATEQSSSDRKLAGTALCHDFAPPPDVSLRDEPPSSPL